MVAVALGVSAWAMDNPLEKADVGDWTLFKVRMMGQEFGAMKIILAAREDSQATLVMEIKSEMMGISERFKHAIGLDGDFDPLSMMGQMPAQGVRKTGEGEEKIELLGKEYLCNWVSFTLDNPDGGDRLGDLKAWYSSDLTFGLAKMSMNIMQGPMPMAMSVEMAETGKGAAVPDLDRIPDMPEAGFGAFGR